MDNHSGGLLFVLAAPSGAGKTTICARLLEIGVARLSVSHTTRPPRSREVEGRDYFFVNEAVFRSMVRENRFLEWAEVYGHLYGTSADWVEGTLRKGRNVLLEIDVQGAFQVKGKIPSAISFFIAPPSLQELQRRLRARGENDLSDMKRRLEQVEGEMAQQKHFDYVIINDSLESAVQRIGEIIRHQSCQEPS